MLKKISFFLLLLLLANTLLLGCSEKRSNDTHFSESFAETASEEVTIAPEQESSNGCESAEEVVNDTVVTFFACPDNIIHPSVYIDALETAAEKNGVKPDKSDLHNAEYDFSEIYSDFSEAIKNADIAYLNQETLIAGEDSSVSGYPRFNTPRAVAEYMVELGFDVFNLAHNHMLDTKNINGLKNCSDLFANLGVLPLGYYPDSTSLNSVPVIENQGIKIAFLTYTYGTNGIKLDKDSCAVIPYFDKELLARQVERAKEISDFVIVSCHWGDENTFKPNNLQKEYAQYMNELGVDLVLGMHPHVIQPAEFLVNNSGKKTLVIYSLGNFVSGMRSGKNMLGLVLEMSIVKDGYSNEIRIDSPLLIPIVTHRDSSFENYHIYYLSDYSEEIAKTHGVVKTEGSTGSLVGGKFSRQTLINTVVEYIDPQFLPSEFRAAGE